MMTFVLLIGAAFLSAVAVAKSDYKSELAWAVLLIAVALLIPRFGY